MDTDRQLVLLREYAGRVRKHGVVLGVGVVGAALTWLGGLLGALPTWVTWLALAAALTWAQYLTWRDERAASRDLQHRSTEIEKQLRQQEEELAWHGELFPVLLRNLPDRVLGPEQCALMVDVLRASEAAIVSVLYRSPSLTRSGQLAWSLVRAFREGGWHAEVRGVDEVEGHHWGPRQFTGVSILLEAMDHVMPAQRTAIEALKAAGQRPVHVPGRAVGNRVELLVGEL